MTNPASATARIDATLAGLAISPLLGLLAAALTIGVLAFLEFVVEPRLFLGDGLR